MCYQDFELTGAEGIAFNNAYQCSEKSLETVDLSASSNNEGSTSWPWCPAYCNRRVLAGASEHWNANIPFGPQHRRVPACENLTLRRASRFSMSGDSVHQSAPVRTTESAHH